jgi:hypothetical protein
MRSKIFVSFAIMTAMWISNVGWAESRLAQIDVLFDRIQIAINGQQTEMSRDSIVYNGSIYVPLRNLSELLGAEVSWDAATETVNLDFIPDSGSKLLVNASLTGMYQYIAVQNNQIIKDMIGYFKAKDSQGVGTAVERYGVLKKIADDMQDKNMSQLFDKLRASSELIRGGMESDSLDEYYIALTMYNSYAEALNTYLKTTIAAVSK